MLEARDIVVEAGGRRLLDKVSIEVRSGRVIALLGPNGAGKSTLLKVLSGDIRPASGAVAMDGAPVATIPARAAARRRAVLTQHSPLDFAFAAEEVVMMGRTPHCDGWAEGPEDHRIVGEAMALTGIRDRRRQAYPSLSGGEKQRVHLARVLAQIWPRAGQSAVPAAGEGRYLLLDEPTASLDAAHAYRILQVARRQAATGCGVLVVLHDFPLASLFADDAVLLDGGRVAATGPVREVLSERMVRAVFGVASTSVSLAGLGDRRIVVPYPVDAAPVEPAV